MNISEKEQAVESISGKFSDSPAAFLIDYKGCSCEDLVSLRRELKPTGAEFAVVKNTLAKRAIADTGVDELAKSFAGPTAVVWAGDDPVTPAKVLTKFVKEQESCSLKSGVVDGKVVDIAEIQQLATLPSKEELFAKLLATINAPATQLARVINAPATDLARLLSAWRDELEKKE